MLIMPNPPLYWMASISNGRKKVGDDDDDDNGYLKINLDRRI